MRTARQKIKTIYKIPNVQKVKLLKFASKVLQKSILQGTRPKQQLRAKIPQGLNTETVKCSPLTLQAYLLY